jgi:hypothetical protein
MKRAAIEKARTRNIWRRHLEGHIRQIVASGGKGKVTCACDMQANRFRKGQKVFGCGRPQCFACHGDKLLGKLKIRDKRAIDRAESSLQELFT